MKYPYIFDTLDKMNTKTHTSHIALLARLKNLLIGNGGKCFFMYTFAEAVHFYVATSSILHGGCTFLMYTLHFSLLRVSFLHMI